MISSSATLEEAKDWLWENLEAGVDCPCCNRKAKLYKRSIYSSQTKGFVGFYKENGKSSNKIDYTRFGQDFPKLRYWGLVEELEEDFWRVTAKGEDWIKGVIAVPKYACIYRSELHELEGEPWSIKDALGEDFDYEELMRR